MMRQTLPFLAAMMIVGCQSGKLEQPDLGELPTPVYIRTLAWDVDGFRRADGAKDIAAFANIIREARPDFVTLTGVGDSAVDIDALAAATGLVASKGAGIAFLSRVKPEEVWKEKEYLVVEQPDFSVTVVDFAGEPNVEMLKRVMRESPRGKVEFFCVTPCLRKGTAAYEAYDVPYRTIADGIGVVRSWGAGGFTFAGEDWIGGTAFRNKAHLVIVKD